MMSSLKVMIDQQQPQAAAAFAAFGEVIALPTAEITAAALTIADVLICRSTLRVDEKLLANSPVKFVGSCAAGVDHVDQDFLRTQKIAFCAANGSNANSVGEYLTAALLAVAVEQKFSLSGKTLGIIGAGFVGKNVAQKARALGMTVLLNDPPLAQQAKTDLVELPELLNASDIVSIHASLNHGGEFNNLQMVDDNFFSAMRDGAIFINAARGKIVVEDALLRALGKRKISAAILDVYASEPRPREELVRKSFLATPHIAGHSYDGKLNGTKIIREQCAKFFDITAEWQSAPPPPDFSVSKIVIESNAAFEVEIDDVVRAVYDIRADAAAFNQAPHNFSALRSAYPIRREFCHTEVSAPAHRPDLTAALMQLGFTTPQQ